jgi:hypothetical protein
VFFYYAWKSNDENRFFDAGIFVIKNGEMPMLKHIIACNLKK